MVGSALFGSGWMVTTGWILHWVVAFVLVASGAVKILKPPKPIVENFTKWGLIRKLKLIGAGELVAGVLLAIPVTSPLGALVVSATWGGAIVIHMAHDESVVAPAAFLTLTWAGMVLKNPALFGLSVIN